MKRTRRFFGFGLLLGLISLTSACLVEARDGYWDRDHHRYYHEHAWHDCGERNNFCH